MKDKRSKIKTNEQMIQKMMMLQYCLVYCLVYIYIYIYTYIHTYIYIYTLMSLLLIIYYLAILSFAIVKSGQKLTNSHLHVYNKTSAIERQITSRSLWTLTPIFLSKSFFLLHFSPFACEIFLSAWICVSSPLAGLEERNTCVAVV